MPTARHARHAFTLIELLVVIAITMVLLSMTMSVTTLVREQAKRTVCASRLKQMGLATIAYGTDNQGFLPLGGPWNNACKGSWDSSDPSYIGLLGYLERDPNDPTWRKRFFMCPSSNPAIPPPWSTDINYSFYAGVPADHPLTISQVLNSARKNVPRLANGQFAMISDNTWVQFPGNGNGGFSTNCNHKRRKQVIWGGSDEGEPAGANVAQSDGSVVWAPYDGVNPNDRELYDTVTMVMNGGSIGGWKAVPSNMVWFRLDQYGNLDHGRWDNYCVGRYANIAFDSNF